MTVVDQRMMVVFSPVLTEDDGTYTCTATVNNHPNYSNFPMPSKTATFTVDTSEYRHHYSPSRCSEVLFSISSNVCIQHDLFATLVNLVMGCPPAVLVMHILNTHVTSTHCQNVIMCSAGSLTLEE